MDEHMANTPVLKSIHCSGELSTSTAEMTKKRKLQYELGNSDLPWPKHKYRSGSSGSGSLVSESPENKGNPLKELTGGEIGDKLEQIEESDHDSNSSIEESDHDSNSSIGVYDNTMMLDVQGKTEKSFSQTFHQDQSSTSSDSPNYDVSKDFLYSLDSRSIKKANKVGSADLQDALQFEPRHEAIEDQYSGFGACSDYMVSEFGKNGMEFADALANDIMLYSNDVAPNAFLLSSGRWSLGQDARLGSRKPTIDQEFEQYFSMLML